MNSRERIHRTLNHEEPDHVPFNLAGTIWTGITNGAYRNLVAHLSLNPEFSDRLIGKLADLKLEF